MAIAPLSTDTKLPPTGSSDWLRPGTVSPSWRMASGAFLLYVCATYLCAIFPHFPVPNDTAIYLYRQDRWLLLVEGALLLLACIRLPDRARPLYLSEQALTLIAIALI